MLTLFKGNYTKGNFKFLRDCIDVPCADYDEFPLSSKCAKCKNKRVCVDIMQLQMYLIDIIQPQLYLTERSVKPDTKISPNQQ